MPCPVARKEMTARICDELGMLSDSDQGLV